jgi:hypothetical protein
MTAERIDFDEFRKEMNIPAADIRSICKQLKLEIIRDGANQYIIGENRFNISNQYLLKHAVFEYRGSMNIERTLIGDFIELEIKTPDGIGYVGVSSFDKDAVSPLTPAIKMKPNKKAEMLLVPAAGAVGITSQITAPEQQRNIGGTDALQVLVAALTEAQKASVAPEALHPQKTLLEAEEHGFLITTEQLGSLLGMSKGTISSKKSGFRKIGFEFEKVKEGSSTLWKAKRY